MKFFKYYFSPAILVLNLLCRKLQARSMVFLHIGFYPMLKEFRYEENNFTNSNSFIL